MKRLDVVLAALSLCVFSVGAPAAGPLPSGAIDADAMSAAFPADGARIAAIADSRAQQAREMAAKSLGDDARDLVFIPVTPCTVWDTRFATDPNSSGIIANAATKKFYSHFGGGGGSYETWGGNPSCPETAENAIGMHPYAVLMTVYVSDATANGWLTFYRDGDPDPSQATISVYYSPGPTRTQAVISKSNRGYGAGTYDVAVTGRFGSAHASASVVGYFLKPVNIVLPNSTATTGNVLKGASRFLHNVGGTFLGVDSGNLAATAVQNTGVGQEALSSTTFGSGNAALGHRALATSAQSPYNVAVGHRALEAAVGDATRGRNTAIGAFALYQNTTGKHNIAIGPDALSNNTVGEFNIAIGANVYSGANVTGSENIVIGNLGVAAESNTIRIGTTGGHNRTFIAGIRSVQTGVANAVPVLIDGSGQLGTISSSREVKDHIADMSEASSGLMKLRPVTFHYKAYAPQARTEYGLIAEEVAQVYPDLVAQSADGKVETVMYQYLPPMMLNEMQKQQRRIVELEAELAALKATVAGLAASRPVTP